MKNKQAGATIVEAAITLPIFFLILFGIFGFGLVMSSYQTMVDAAREAARYGAAPRAGAGYALPTAATIAQRSCNYLTGTVLGGNKGCSKYTGGGTTPPPLTSCTDSAFTSTTAVEDVYVGLPPSTVPESYTVTNSTGNNTVAQQQVVVGIRKTVNVPVLKFTFKLRTCSSMRSENAAGG